MTDERMALLELIEKDADADLVRELLAFAAERMMAVEVDELTGAPAGVRSAERVNHRNGYRQRGPLDRDRGKPCGSPLPHSHTTGHTDPYHGGSLDYAAPGVMAGRPSAARSAFESAMSRAGLAAIRQGPCALPTVRAASRRGTPRRVNGSNRFRPWRHCFHTKARSRRRSHWCKVRNTDGVWQKPK
jgi:hypothetical protein